MSDRTFEEIAYEQLFTLTNHYSQLIFKARLMIISVVLILWGLSLGFYQFGSLSPIPKLETVFPYLGALAVAYFPLLEAIYIKMYWSTFEAGEILESSKTIYFSRRKAPVIWPFMSFYFLNCFAFIGLYIFRLPQDIKWYSVFAIFPLVFLSAALYYLTQGKVDKAQEESDEITDKTKNLVQEIS